MTIKRTHFGGIILLLALTLLGLFAVSSVFAQSARSRYFPETGHWVSGEFLDKYESATAPEDLFGLPITDQFEDQVTGRTIQYFENVRFEFHPNDPQDIRVKLSFLGEFLYDPEIVLPVPPNSPACEAFITGYSVCFAFLDFFIENGGVTQFGYPISGFEIHDDWIVQYFQSARFEWHPELPTGQRVKLTNLGRRYFYSYGENPYLLRPNIGNNGIPLLEQPPESLKVYAFTKVPILSFQSDQTIHVIVRDQYLRPLENAVINLEIYYPNGAMSTYQVEPSNQNGIGTLSFPVNLDTSGIVEIIVTATYQTLQQQTKTSFQIWW